MQTQPLQGDQGRCIVYQAALDCRQSVLTRPDTDADIFAFVSQTMDSASPAAVHEAIIQIHQLVAAAR